MAENYINDTLTELVYVTRLRLRINLNDKPKKTIFISN